MQFESLDFAGVKSFRYDYTVRDPVSYCSVIFP